MAWHGMAWLAWQQLAGALVSVRARVKAYARRQECIYRKEGIVRSFDDSSTLGSPVE